MDAPKNRPINPLYQPDLPSPDQSSSATGVFGQVQAAPLAEEDLLASLLGQATPEKKVEDTEQAKPAVFESPQAQPAAPLTAAPAKTAAPAAEAEALRGPGEFTRMLQALTTPGASGIVGSNAAPKTPEMARTEEVARVFRPVAMEKPADVPTIGVSTPASRPVSPTPAPPSQAPNKQAGSGEFTRMFSSQGPATASASVSSAPISAPPPAAPQSGPGEFTRMFSSPMSSGGAMPPSQVSESRPGAAGIPPSQVSESRPGAPTMQPEPGAFTKMFATQGASAPPQEDPLKSLRGQAPSIESGLHLSVPQAPAASSQAPAAAGGFTQLLQALNQEPKPKEPAPLATSSFGPMTPSPVSPSPISAPPAPVAPAAAGGFTQLLQSLAQPEALPSAPPPLAPAPFAAPAAPLAAPFAAAPPAPASPWATPPSLTPSAPPPMASGPGEFTRVISGSALRDLQGGQGMQAATPPPPAAGTPWSPPQMQKPAMPAAPAMPGMAAMPGMHAGMPPAAGGGMPFAPQAFEMPPAVPPPAAPPQTTLQKYLPLILVVNVFLLLVIVLILVFVFHHK